MSDEESAGAPFMPIVQRTVDFYGDEVPAAQLADGTILVPLRPIVTALGLDWSAQAQRLKRDARLNAAQGVVIITTPGGRQTMTALPLRLLPGWLFKLDVARVRPELRAKIERYQEECYEVLWEAFRGEIGALPTPPAPLASGAALALEIATAIQHLAQQQLAMEAHLDQVGNKQEVMAGYLRGFVRTTQARLTVLELRLPAGGTITEAQAGELALAVKAVGQSLVTAGDRNGYQKVYGEMYRRYGISSYKNLPAGDYAGTIAWLQHWYRELTGSAPPFAGPESAAAT